MPQASDVLKKIRESRIFCDAAFLAAKNNKNQTPLQVAAINRCKANVEVLMNLQACTATDLNQKIQSLQKIGQVDQEIMSLLEGRVKE